MTTVKKKLPYELYDVAGLEDWFSQMAAEGYHLEDCWENRAEFRVGEPTPGVRFRLEAQGTYEYDWNQDEAYLAGGWDHVTTIRGFFCIFRCDDPAAPELHTDPKIQSWTMKKLIRRRWFWVLWYAVYWVFIVNIRLGMSVGGAAEAVRYLLLEDGILLVYGASLVFVAHFLLVQTIQTVMLARLKRRLASGLPVNREKRYPRSFWMHGFQIVLIGGLILTLFVGSTLCQEEAVTVNPEDYPCVRVEEVVSVGTFEGERLERRYQAEIETSVLVPLQLRYLDGIYPNDWSGILARVGLNYYETISPVAAKLLLRGEMLDLKQGLRNSRAKQHPNAAAVILDTGAVQTDFDGLDELWVWDYQYENADHHRIFFGRKGTTVFVLTTVLPEPELALEVLLSKIPS